MTERAGPPVDAPRSGGAPGAPAGQVVRAARGMGVATAASRAIGFVRVLAIAAILGTTYLGNAYQSSNSVSNVLFELLAAGALSAVLVPTFVEHLDRDDHREAERLAGAVLGIALVGLGVVALVGVLAAPWIARLLTSGVDDPTVAAQQEHLSTFLLRFFVPQVLLYAVGAVSVAVLYAKRRLAVTALAPIGLTVVVVVALGIFRLQAGPDPGLDLSLAERLNLALGGTLGVAAFVGIPVYALHRSGFRLRPRLARPDPAVQRLLRLSGWAVFQHTLIGLLLAAAVITGNRVEGGTLAYQVAWIFFLAPYAVLAQPIHTAILPELARDADRPDAFAGSLRWALDNMALLVIPVSVALVALAEPIMELLAFGQADRAGGVGLLAAGLASLAIGLYGYSAFLLFARAHYAQHDSRTPALVALVSAAVGIAVMAVGASLTEGAATVAMIGLGHTSAYAVGAVVLGVGLARRTRGRLLPGGVALAAGLAIPLGIAAWWVAEALDPHRRLALLAMLAGILGVAGALYVLGLRVVGGRAVSLRPRGVGGVGGQVGEVGDVGDVREVGEPPDEAESP